MSNQEVERNNGEEVPRPELRLEVKETRHGKILIYADNAAPNGFRGMTEIELKAHDYLENLVALFDTESVKPGRVGTVRFDDSGQPDVEWCRDDAQAAAGGGS